jgi:NAD(P)H-flavin reductase
MRYEKLSAAYSEDMIRASLDPASLEILEEFLAHGRAVLKERERAAASHEKPNFIKLIRQWGGVTIVYRRTMQESPAYINNHEELSKALEEGIYYLEALEPTSVALNQFGHVETLVCQRRIRIDKDTWEPTKEDIRIPARSIFVATGTQPNIAYEFEHRGTFTRVGFQYQHYEDINGALNIPHGIVHCKEPDFGPFTSYHNGHRRVSLIGDTHPVFHGNVVKAIASGLRTYPKILDVLQDKLGKQGNTEEYNTFAMKMKYLFSAKISHIQRYTDNVIELTIDAPLAAKHYQPGQFYRLQNYETFSPHMDHTSLQIEPIALIASNVDHANGSLKFIVIENGASTKLCATFKPGDPVSLMGPTGVRSKISNESETVLIIGSQISMALLQSYGSALRQAGNKIIYFGYFKSKNEVYCQDQLEEIADLIIWGTETEDCVIKKRDQDYSAQGDMLDILLRYAQGTLDPDKKHPEISLMDVDRVFITGNTALLRSFQEARKTKLKEFLIKDPRIFGSVHSTMQCMLKGVCAQCLQWQIDPETGKRTKAVFACSWSDQPLELIDIDNIDERRIQNQLQEKISSLWVDYLFDKYAIDRV